jgi:hypothetical protein
LELRDGSAWRIWPGDIPKALQRLPTTEIDVADIDDEICSHALIDRSSAQWPAAAVRRARAAIARTASTRRRETDLGLHRELNVMKVTV